MIVTIDRAGRIVVPKPFRDRFNLVPGTELAIEAAGDGVTLRKVGAEPGRQPQAAAPQPVMQAMQQDGMEPGAGQNGLDGRARRRVSGEDRRYIFFETLEHERDYCRKRRAIPPERRAIKPWMATDHCTRIS